MSAPVPAEAKARVATAAPPDATDPEQSWARDGTIDFTMIDVGPWDELCRRLRVREAMPRVMFWHALLPAIVVWLPCLLLSTFAASASDPAAISFLEDVSVHVRFLVLVPLLVLAEWDIGRQTRIAAAGFVVGKLVPPEERPRFEAAVREEKRLVGSPVAELLLAAIAALVMSVVARTATVDGFLYWYETGSATASRLTGAGWWYMAGSTIPLFLILRWGWRYAVWCLFLLRMARLRLQYLPTHPDRAAGIGFVGIGHAPFCLVGAGVSCLLTAVVGTRILHMGATLKNFQVELISIVVIITAIGLLPMLVFLPALASARRRGLLQHGEFSTRFVRDVERKMRESRDGKDEVKGEDIQSLADIGGSYERLREMRLVPIDLLGAMLFAASAGLPMFVLVLANVPFEQVIKLLMQALG